MNIKELCRKAGISYPTINAFLNDKNSVGLKIFQLLVSAEDGRILSDMIERTKNRIKRESGKRGKL